MTIKKVLIWVLILIPLVLFFSYRLTQVPSSLTVDEAAFGYNAVLLSETGYDENGRFLPFFVLSIKGQDWRQPVTQYMMTIFFKIFGASKYKLRITSILVILASLVLIYYLAKMLLGKLVAISASLIYLTVPIMMIHSHLGLDNIMPIPFVLFWLIFLFLSGKNGKKIFLILSGASLGIGFYTYKGMRAIVPVWCLLTVGFLFIRYKENFKQFLTKSLYFSLGTLPFFVVIPLLQQKYAGAVFDSQSPQVGSIYNLFFGYLSSYDLSFLFVQGDQTIYHSTGRHGMYLLASLPLFLSGIYYLLSQGRKEERFVLAAFVTGPLLYGMVNSVHRASRLMALIPLFAIIAGCGIKFFRGSSIMKRLILVIVIGLMIVNYADFVNYYWWKYPDQIGQQLSEPIEDSYRGLAESIKEKGYQPYISNVIFKADGESAKFYEAAFFDQPVAKWEENQDLPDQAVLLTQRKEIEGLEQLEVDLPKYYLQVKK